MADDHVRAHRDLDRALALDSYSVEALDYRGRNLAVLAERAPPARRTPIAMAALENLRRADELAPGDENVAGWIAWLERNCASGTCWPEARAQAAPESSTFLDRLADVSPIGWLLLGLALANVVHWVRGGFWLPRYLHLAGMAALIFIAGIAILTRSAGDVPLSRRLLAVAAFAAVPYVLFVFLGGSWTRRFHERRGSGRERAPAV